MNATGGPGTLRKSSGCDGCLDASAVSTQATNMGGRASAPWRAGDVFRVAVDAAGVVTCTRDGSVFYTSATRASAALRAAVVFATAGASVGGTRPAGGSAPVPSTTAITWATLVNASVAGTRISKTSGYDGCFDGLGVSADTIDAGGGALEFRVVDPARLLVTGLSDGLGEPGDVDFGLRGGEVREQGAYRADVPVVANDLRRIAVDAAGVVTHARNGAVFYTGATRAVAPLRAVVVMAPLGAGIDGPRLVAAASSAATITSRRPGTTARPAARDGTGVAVCRHMPDMSSLACPKCGAHSLRLVLKTSWGEYYACAPCQWSIYSTDRAGFVAGSADPLIAAPLPIRTPASGGDTAHA